MNLIGRHTAEIESRYEPRPRYFSRFREVSTFSRDDATRQFRDKTLIHAAVGIDLMLVTTRSRIPEYAPAVRPVRFACTRSSIDSSLWYRLFAESRVEGYPVSTGHIILAYPADLRLFLRVIPRYLARGTCVRDDG